MLLNSKNNQFVFRFPKGFIYSEIEKKYNYYINRLPTPFENMTDYVNHTIQSVTFPAVGSDEVEQWVGLKTDLPGGQHLTKKTVAWRQSLDMNRIIPKEFSVNFKATDAYLNYWVMFELFQKYLEVTNKEDFLPNLDLMYLDRDGHQILRIKLFDVLMKGISEVEMSYSATAMEFRTFSCTFKYNYFEIDVDLD